MMRTGWQRIVAGAATAVAPLAVALALGAVIAHADTYAERGGGISKRLARKKIQTREETCQGAWPGPRHHLPASSMRTGPAGITATATRATKPIASA